MPFWCATQSSLWVDTTFTCLSKMFWHVPHTNAHSCAKKCSCMRITETQKPRAVTFHNKGILPVEMCSWQVSIFTDYFSILHPTVSLLEHGRHVRVSNLDHSVGSARHKPFIAWLNIDTAHPALMTTDHLYKHARVWSLSRIIFTTEHH